jgi:dihydroxyacetone kinase-like protein
MNNTITDKQIINMILAAVAAVKKNHELLSRLDTAAGDGDHGTTMLRSMKAAEDTINASTSDNIKDLLYKIGWSVMSADGGSTGPLLGSFFIGMSEAVDQVPEFNNYAVAEMIVAGANKMQKQSRAQIGDRTMMDAMLPAVDALKAADKNANLPEILELAAKAANDGAEATKDMKAKFGRARNLGDRVLGHKDPGAVSIALIFQGFYESFND